MQGHDSKKIIIDAKNKINVSFDSAVEEDEESENLPSASGLSIKW